MRVLVTGAAGFIGYHVSRQLLDRGDEVLGVDNLNPYYNPQLKRDRLAQLTSYPAFKFSLLNIADPGATNTLIDMGHLDVTVHLAAQAGVRYSQEAPQSYAASNVTGTLSVLEACRARGPHHLVFASSSSVYGESMVFPVRESADLTRPVSLYAATKMASELMAYSYADQYGLAMTALRLFTVYGPWGRPDMAVFKFTEAILAGRPVELYAGGVLQRDFTFVGDIVQGILGAIDHPPEADAAKFRAYNLGRGAPASVLELLDELERCLERRAVRRTLPPQVGDVKVTFADIRAAQHELGYQPSTSLSDGIRQFVEWYRNYSPDLNVPLRRSA
jgi:UDP-glucuronate 4-epimerase